MLYDGYVTMRLFAYAIYFGLFFILLVSLFQKLLVQRFFLLHCSYFSQYMAIMISYLLEVLFLRWIDVLTAGTCIRSFIA